MATSIDSVDDSVDDCFGIRFFYNGMLTIPAKDGNGKEMYEYLLGSAKEFIISQMREGLTRKHLVEVAISYLDKLRPQIMEKENFMRVINLTKGVDSAKNYFVKFILPDITAFGSNVILVAQLRGLPPSETFGILCTTKCENKKTIEIERMY